MLDQAYQQRCVGSFYSTCASHSLRRSVVGRLQLTARDTQRWSHRCKDSRQRRQAFAQLERIQRGLQRSQQVDRVLQ